MNQRYVLKTFGCKANFSDSHSIEVELQKKGWEPRKDLDQDVDLCIINSCTVTDEADRQARKMAAKLAKDNPQAKVVVTGCGAEVDPDSFKKATGVHYVVGNQNKDILVNLVLSEMQSPHDKSESPSEKLSSNITSHILQHEYSPNQSEINSSGKILGNVQRYNQILSKHPTEREWPALTESFFSPTTQTQGFSDKTRAFLKIQEGCNSFCTYCIIPYGRGPSRSLDIPTLILQAHQLVSQGVKEIVITGTNIGDYGTDTHGKPVLEDLLERILEETSLARLRVSSLDPVEISPRLLNLAKQTPRFCPHFHVSLQSPHSQILRLMKRKYRFEQVKECLEKIAEISAPHGGPFVGMDIITGFPGEGEEEFEWGYEALSQLPWSRLHVFPYSERSGTPATRLPQSVHRHVRAIRAKKLNQLSMERLRAHYQKVLNECTSGQLPLENVLLEKGSDQWVSGYTPNYLRVLIQSTDAALSQNLRNQLVAIMPIDLIVDSKSNDVALLGRIVPQNDQLMN